MLNGFTALVVDDEPQIALIIEYALQTQGFRVLVAHDGATALNLLRMHEIGLAILDVLMPSMDGLTLCERIKSRTDIPVLLLTALDQHEDIIKGLEYGADDYVTKPFHPREVALRAQALVRRHRDAAPPIHIGQMTLDLSSNSASFAGRRLDLPYTEFKVLAHLARHAGTPCSWQQLLRDVWGTTDLAGGRDVVKTTVYRLRSRLSALPNGAAYIRTLRGIGYQLADPTS